MFFAVEIPVLGEDLPYENSTITQWKELAEAFLHQPSSLWYDDNGVINHNGTEKGYLYIIDEPVTVGVDICQHPRTTMDKNAELAKIYTLYLTNSSLMKQYSVMILDVLIRSHN